MGAVVAVGIAAGTWLFSEQDGRPHGDVLVPTETARQLPQGVPATCPLTIPTGAFDPPDDYDPGPGEGAERQWYGSLDLWTALARNGEVIGPNDQAQLAVRYFMWSTHQPPPREEPNPDLAITARPVDGDGPAVRNAQATNGIVSTNVFMITSLVLPEPGCWEITAEFREHRLSWTIWAESSSVSESE